MAGFDSRRRTVTNYGRPTMHNGTQYRSRLEAEFASYLDRHDKVDSYEYEPVAFAAKAGGSYLPDFRLHFGPHTHYIETKPDNADVDEALTRMHAILDSEPEALLQVVIGIWVDGHGYTFKNSITCSIDDPCGKCRRLKPRTSVSDMLGYPNRHDGGSIDLLCVCGSDDSYVHLMEVESSETRGASVDRLGVTLRFGCEMCGGGFALKIDNDKGSTVIRLDPNGGVSCLTEIVKDVGF